MLAWSEWAKHLLGVEHPPCPSSSLRSLGEKNTATERLAVCCKSWPQVNHFLYLRISPSLYLFFFTGWTLVFRPGLHSFFLE